MLENMVFYRWIVFILICRNLGTERHHVRYKYRYPYILGSRTMLHVFTYRLDWRSKEISWYTHTDRRSRVVNIVSSGNICDTSTKRRLWCRRRSFGTMGICRHHHRWCSSWLYRSNIQSSITKRRESLRYKWSSAFWADHMEHFHIHLLFCISFYTLPTALFTDMAELLLHGIIWCFKDIRLDQKILVLGVFDYVFSFNIFF